MLGHRRPRGRRRRASRTSASRIIVFEEIDEPDGAFDVVLCREGLMFAIDPARACAEAARVLRPGGRIAAAAWGGASATRGSAR